MATTAFSILFPFVALVTILYILYGVIYRLYLSPIAKFPGRKLAALTLWYEFYYDVFKVGEYTSEIKKMHEEYGTYHAFGIGSLYTNVNPPIKALLCASIRTNYTWP